MREKVDRILEIISRLDRKERVNPEFLAKKLRVSTRTIYRDLELISSAHFPIYYDRAGKTYRFLEGFSLRRLNLSKEEIRILLLSRRLFTRLAEPSKRAADKVLEKFMESGESQLKLDFDEAMGFDYSPHFMGPAGGKAGEVVVKLDKAVSHSILKKKWHPSQEVEELKSGDVIIRFKNTTYQEIKPWIYSWIPYCEVIRPRQLRELVKKELKQASRLYQH